MTNCLFSTLKTCGSVFTQFPEWLQTLESQSTCTAIALTPFVVEKDSIPLHRQRGGAAELEGVHIVHRIDRSMRARKHRDYALQRGGRFHPRERGAEAEVRAETERQGRIRHLTIDVELRRVAAARTLVAIRRGDQHRHPRTFRNRRSRDGHILSRAAENIMHRRIPS